MKRLLPYFALAFATLFSGCLLDSSAGSERTEDGITVAIDPPTLTITNGRADPIVLTVVETETSHLIDLTPCSMRTDFQVPGDSVTLRFEDIEGYSDEAASIRVFWCSLDPDHSGMIEVPLD